MTTSPLPHQFQLHPNANPVGDVERGALLASPGFGKVFTDHMVTMRYLEGVGWHSPQLVPFGPISLSPATAALHYAQEIFEGLKAYRAVDGGIVTFRPLENARRFNRSATRLAMPELPEELFIAAIQVLVEHDAAWVPDGDDASLYLRPLMFATDVFLGVRPAHEYLFILMASPAGAYFARGVAPVSVWLSTDYVRAAPGGTGEAKCAGNYAASLAAQAQAEVKGCDQVVWLDANEHRWVEEMGGMNLFFVFTEADGATTLVTPELSGSLLPGVTRDSLLRLAPDLGYRVVERRISTTEWREAAASGQMTEAFACGTAAVITPIGVVKSGEGVFTMGDGSAGAVAMRLRHSILDIQRGRSADEHDWVYPLVKAVQPA